jgi:hypothetical protein
MAADGQTPGVKVSGTWRVPLEAVLDLERRERLRGRSRSSMHPYCLIHQRTTQASHTAAVTTSMTANP